MSLIALCSVRSPLSIVHEGLDIIRSEIEASEVDTVVFMSPKTAKMIRNIFSASETSINILNDLLHCEHIDAGDLNCSNSLYSYIVCF